MLSRHRVWYVAPRRMDGCWLGGQEAVSHGDQLPQHVHMAVHDVLQPPSRVAKGDKQYALQLLGLCAWVWVVGHRGGVWFRLGHL